MVSFKTFTAALSAISLFTSVGASPAPAKKPKNIGFVGFPGTQPLDVFGPLDAIWGLSRQVPLNVYWISDSLNPVNTEIKIIREGSPNSNVSVTYLTDSTFDNPPQLDALFVPGGIGTRIAHNPKIPLAIDFVKRIYPSLDYIISVCTGATILSRAGILDGKRATTNKNAWAWATTVGGNNTRWQPYARYVRDGNIWTSAGVSAGVDATLGWIDYVWGNALATTVANGMEWERKYANDDIFGKLRGL